MALTNNLRQIADNKSDLLEDANVIVTGLSILQVAEMGSPRKKSII